MSNMENPATHRGASKKYQAGSSIVSEDKQRLAASQINNPSAGASSREGAAMNVPESTFAVMDETVAPSLDPGLVFLERAAARLVLVEAGEMDIETAIIELIEPFEQLIGPLLCDCSRDIVARWERDYPPVGNERPPSTQPTPQTTIEAILFCVRERGVQALKEAANIERLSCCDEAAKAQLNARIANG
jgi:hypothetical protein